MPPEIENQNQMPQLREPLIERARRYWRQHLPQEFARLSKKGKLEAHLASLVSQYETQFGRLIGQGMDPTQAEELTRETLFPPEEPTLDDEVLHEGEEPYHQDPDDVAKVPGWPGERTRWIRADDPRLRPHVVMTGLTTAADLPANPNRKKPTRRARKSARVNRRQNRQ